MIEIKIYTVAVQDAGKPEREQVAESLAAIGFFRPEDLTTAPTPTSLTPAETADEPAAPKTRGRPKKEAAKPDAPADPAPAEAAQDAADEKAEQEAAKPAPEPEKPVKFGQEDMRAAGKAYADAYGMEACLEDIPAIIGYAAFKLVPEDKFDEVTRAVQAAVASNPNNRTKKA